MGTFRNAKATIADLGDASKKIGEAAEWQTVALVTVAAVSITALLLATVALLGQEPPR